MVMCVGKQSSGLRFLPVFRLGLAVSALAIVNGSAVCDEPLPLEGRRVAGLRLADGIDAVAQIASATRIQFFVGKNETWNSTTVTVGSPELVPGAPLVLTTIDKEPLPQVLTVGAAGRLLQVTPRAGGAEIAPFDEAAIPSRIHFPPGGDFATALRPKRIVVFAVDEGGKFWEFDSRSGEPTLIEGRSDLLVPGGAVRTLPDEGNELFLVDRRGNLISYLRDPIVRWKGPRLIGTDFVAGTDVSVWRRPDPPRELQVAAVNVRGELQIGRWDPTGWKVEMAPGWLLPAGSPVGVAHTPVNMRFCGIAADGTLLEMHLQNTEWRDRTFAGGFAWKSNNVMLPYGPLVFGIDIAGQFISASHAEEKWTVRVTASQPAVETARLVQREWKRSDVGANREIAFVNTSMEELIVRIGNRRDPASLVELRVAPSSSVSFDIASDAGGELRDVVRPAAVEGTPPDQIRTIPTPPQCLYDVEVLAAREENIAYVDMRQIPRRVDSHAAKSPLGLGRFAISPDDGSRTGARVDLLKSAANRQLSLVQP